MISGVSSEFSGLQRKHIDADDFLIKPFDVENFLERIDSLLENRRQPAEEKLKEEERLLGMFHRLSDDQKAQFLKEAERLVEEDH